MSLCARGRKWLAVALAAPWLMAAGASRIVDVSIVGGKADGGVRTVRVERGEVIALRVRADEATTVHLHGYDIELRVPAQSSASVELTARIVGRFPVTAHLPSKGGKKPAEPTLLYLEVHPK
jgi:hypothetical protein